LIVILCVAGLNSTPALIGVCLFVICLQALKVSYERAIHQRDKKGKVSRMKSVAIRIGDRNLAASLAATCSAVAGCVALSGGSG
jgi:hypothetical protein